MSRLSKWRIAETRVDRPQSPGVAQTKVLVRPASHPAARRAGNARVLIKDLGALLDADRADVQPVASGDDVNLSVRAMAERAIDELVIVRPGRNVSGNDGADPALAIASTLELRPCA